MTTYTGAQRQAIDCVDEPLQIIACAGSGKTQVISQRIADLLRSGRTEPRNIVAFTFTEKASAELKDRVLSLVNEGGHRQLALAEMYIGTMHAYCLGLLKDYVPETFKFGVLTDVTARLFIDRHSKASGLTVCPTSSPKVPHLKRYLNSDLYQQVVNLLREDAVDLTLVPDAVVSSYVDYVRLLGQKAYFDYSGMLDLTVQLLGSEDPADTTARALLRHVEEDIRYVVVDEYQDTNPLQERLINGLTRFGANLCVVGDDDQTIYQWRGSAVRNIIDFANRRGGVEQVTLDDNFRSSPGVVELAQTVAERLPLGERLAKRMVASGHQQWSRGDLLAVEFPDEAAEASWICDKIQAMRGVPFVDHPHAAPRGLSWSDVAVLYRSVGRDAGPLVEEMRRRGIPYVVKGLTRLFDSAEITAVVGIFSYMADEIDAPSLRGLWEAANLIPRGADWTAAATLLDARRDFHSGERWSVYNLQRLYLDLLETLGIREDTIPGEPGRGELVLYQLGKFSQVISDFEEIHFQSAPHEKYPAFAAWLRYQAPRYYDDGDGDVGYAQPDAVTISTVHQAKGMQWPVVVIPCLRKNVFPSQRHGGLGVFHVLPDTAIPDADRYRGTVQDETRLFYVAVTRAQKWLFATYSPGTSRNYKRRSEFFDHCTGHARVNTRDPSLPSDAGKLPPQSKVETPQVTLSFSELKYYFECPYAFKMRFLYGFNAPLHEALGYGKGLHDALAEMHKRALRGDLVVAGEVESLVDRHLHTPYAYPELRAQLRRAAVDAVHRYLREHGDELRMTEHSEKAIQVHLGDGITVEGRIDLIRRLDTDEVSVVDFKSTDRAQPEDVTRDQLHIYAVGYEELSGHSADLIEVLNLDEEGKNTRENVDTQLLTSTRDRVKAAGQALRAGDLPRHSSWCTACSQCDYVALCRRREAPANAG